MSKDNDSSKPGGAPPPTADTKLAGDKPTALQEPEAGLKTSAPEGNTGGNARATGQADADPLAGSGTLELVVLKPFFQGQLTVTAKLLEEQPHCKGLPEGRVIEILGESADSPGREVLPVRLGEPRKPKPGAAKPVLPADRIRLKLPAAKKNAAALLTAGLVALASEYDEAAETAKLYPTKALAQRLIAAGAEGSN